MSQPRDILLCMKAPDTNSVPVEMLGSGFPDYDQRMDPPIFLVNHEARTEALMHYQPCIEQSWYSIQASDGRIYRRRRTLHINFDIDRFVYRDRYFGPTYPRILNNFCFGFDPMTKIQHVVLVKASSAGNGNPGFGFDVSIERLSVLFNKSSLNRVLKDVIFVIRTTRSVTEGSPVGAQILNVLDEEMLLRSRAHEVKPHLQTEEIRELTHSVHMRWMTSWFSKHEFEDIVLVEGQRTRVESDSADGLKTL